MTYYLDKLNKDNIRIQIEEAIFGDGEIEIILPSELFNHLYLRLVNDKIINWDGNRSMSSISLFYYPFSDCIIYRK